MASPNRKRPTGSESSALNNIHNTIANSQQYNRDQLSRLIKNNQSYDWLYQLEMLINQHPASSSIEQDLSNITLDEAEHLYIQLKHNTVDDYE